MRNIWSKYAYFDIYIVNAKGNFVVLSFFEKKHENE